MYGRTDHVKYQNGCKEVTNFLIIPQGGLTRRPGFQYIAAAKNADKKCRLIPFQFSITQAYVLEFGDSYIRFYKDGGQIVDPNTLAVIEVSSPWDEGEIFNLTFVQSADQMFIAHPDHAPRVLSRTSHTDWTLSEFEYRNGPFRARNTTDTTLSVSATTGTGLTMTASADVFSPGHVGVLFKLEEQDLGEYEQWEAAEGYTSGDHVLNNGRIYEAQNTESAGPQPPVHTEGTQADGGGSDHVKWKYLHSGFGIVKITQYISPTEVLCDVQEVTTGVDAVLPETVTPSGTAHTSTTKWSEGAWSDIRGYPRAIAFFEQRLVFGGTSTDPQQIWASQINDFPNFLEGTLDTDAYSYVLTSGTGKSRPVNAVKYLTAGRTLIAHTTGGETVVSSSDLNGVVTPSNITARNQTDVGAGSAQPVAVDSVVLTGSRSNRRLHEILFSFEQDRYVSPDLTILADHITKPEPS